MDHIEEYAKLLRVLGYIGVLGALAYFLSRFLKAKKYGKISTESDSILITATHSLGNRQFLVVAKCEKQKHLLGVSPVGITHLAKLGENAPMQEGES